MFPPRYQDSRAVIVVLADRFYNPVLPFEDFSDFIFLSITKFKHQFPCGIEDRCGVPRKPAGPVQPVRPAIKRHPRLKIAHLRLESFDF